MTRETEGWAVVGPDNEIRYATETKFTDKAQAESVLLRSLTASGYRCIKVRIVPVEAALAAKEKKN